MLCCVDLFSGSLGISRHRLRLQETATIPRRQVVQGMLLPNAAPRLMGDPIDFYCDENTSSTKPFVSTLSDASITRIVQTKGESE